MIQMIPFAEEQIKEIAEIERQCFSDPWTEEGLREELTNDCARFLTAINEDGIVCGYIGCHTILDEGYITNVAVSPAFRRQGIGRLLVETLQQKSSDLCFLTLEVRAGNAPAIKLYEECGFQPVGTRKNFYTHPTEDAWLMTWIRKPD